MIELRQFRQFVAVAEELSFRRAAERLHMAQPPLTAAIRKIEQELGTRLLERSNRVRRLTEAGLIFLEEARRAIAQADHAIHVTRRAGEGLVGSLRIMFVGAGSAHDLLPRVLRVFRVRHAEVELELRQATTAEQVAALMAGRADLCFVVPPLLGVEGITTEDLFTDVLVAALPEDHPLTQRRRPRLSDLSDESWLLYPRREGPGLHGRVVAACSQAGFTPRIVQEAVQMDTIVSLVAGGLGITLTTRSFGVEGRRGVVFRELYGTGTPITFELALAYRRMSPVAEAFAAIVHSEAKATKSLPRTMLTPR
ncbi:MAG TPA: LysR family transcriptional regulator [Stellaceae bacterium]|nr:LysR family transcriptional regulator [Stellaceae bacterium]